jgi:hypothetical protein
MPDAPAELDELLTALVEAEVEFILDASFLNFASA